MAVPTATVDGLPESVFPYAVVVTSVRPLDRKWRYRTLARKARYLTVSNSWESETPSARASRNRLLKDGFRRAVSIPPRYVRCICANSARRS